MSQKDAGNYFEDFRLGQEFRHPTPRTVTAADAALYTALYGARFAAQSSDEFSRAIGLPRAPLDDLLVFHVVFGKTVSDISRNAVANLGYADCRWLAPVYPGDTLHSVSTVIGLRENSNRQTGVVYVRSKGINQAGVAVLDYARWVMVKKDDANATVPAASVPELATSVAPARLTPPAGLNCARYDDVLAGSTRRWEDYAPGQRIDHRDGMTVEDAEHQLATRLYQNTATVHFNRHAAASTRHGQRLVYGGHVISLARALSFNGLENAAFIAAINAGRHVNPVFAGDTIYAWSEVIAAAPLLGRTDLGALRLRTVAAKDRPCADFPGADAGKDAAAGYPAEVVLDLDYWALLPRRAAKPPSA